METVDSFVEDFDLGAGSSSVPSKVSLVNKVDSSSDVYNFETEVALQGRDLVMKLNKCWLSSSPDAASSTASTTSLIEMGCSANDQVEILMSGRKKTSSFCYEFSE